MESFTTFTSSAMVDHLIFPEGGDAAYERRGDARRIFWIKPLKETDPGVAQAFFNPLKRPY